MMNLATSLTASIKRMTTPGGMVYTEQQLYYEVCRTLLPLGIPQRDTYRAGLMGMLATSLLVRQPRRIGYLLLAAVATAGVLRGVQLLPFTLPPPLTYNRFRTLLEAHVRLHGWPPGLLSSSAPPPLAFTGDAPDLTDYGVPQVLVCQHAAIAQMLHANMLHMEARCVILDLSTATPLPEPLCAMLARTPEARVYLLHDASAAGLALVPRLREQFKLPAAVGCTAVGLRPAHARRLHLVAQRTEEHACDEAAWPRYLNQHERAWLQAGHSAEIAAVRPAHLLLTLRRILLGYNPPAARLPDWRRARALGFMTWPER